MPKQEIWLFGNPDLPADSLPLIIQPKLRQLLPQFSFIIKDPHEEWQLPPQLIIIDTILGINRVTAFTSLDQFTAPPRLTLHDFDLFTQLHWLAKLNQLPPFTIIGLPPDISKQQAIKKITAILQKLTVSQ